MTTTVPGNPPTTPEPTPQTNYNPRRKVQGKKRCTKIFHSSLDPAFPDHEHRASVFKQARDFMQESFGRLSGPYGESPSDRDKRPRISHNRTPHGKVIGVLTWRNRQID